MSKESSSEYILVVTDDPGAPQETSVPTSKGWENELRRRVKNVARVPADLLEANMNRFLQFVGRLFKQVDQQIGMDSDMKLDEVELSIEISGKGEIKLVAGAEGKSAITLKFKRVEK